MNTIPLEHHLPVVNSIAAIVFLVVLVPVPVRPGSRWWHVLLVSVGALALSIALLSVAALEITAAQPDAALAGDPDEGWGVDPEAPQWVELYALWVLSGAFVCLSSRLWFSRGVNRRWSLAAAGAAVTCVIGALALWGSA